MRKGDDLISDGGLKPVSVSVFCGYIKQIIASEDMLRGICIIGEIAEIRQSKGYVFFTLKDSSCRLECIAFPDTCIITGNVSDYKVGDSVICSGSPSFYVKTGSFRFIAYRMMPFGEGEIEKKRRELFEKLKAEGLFDDSHKKPLPRFATRIGIITAEGAAALTDIKKIATARNSSVELVLIPSGVQGDAAKKELVSAFARVDAMALDAVILARGGGSNEDLGVFYDETVVRAFASIKLPKISAVGHERDVTFVDFVADVRAATPSEAAEIAVFSADDYLRSLVNRCNKMRLYIVNGVKLGAERISSRSVRLYSDSLAILRKNDSQRKLKLLKIQRLIQTSYGELEYGIKSKIIRLKSLSYFDNMKRGFIPVFSGRKHIKSIKTLSLGDEVRLCFADGEASAKIMGIKK